MNVIDNVIVLKPRMLTALAQCKISLNKLAIVKESVDDTAGAAQVAMILYEVLRLYPLIVLLIRGTNKKMKLGEVILPPSTEITLQTVLVHCDLGLWGEDAEEFNPERFSGGVSKAAKNPVSFFPFD
ncbi:hypothetical protein IFM89_035507 [Coptis chinensis]|uniref:Uncharacterized protein n=1 Tax=Coptis chinensis TaxID=261450 RepID=A0A835LJM9_9MAGN|nr:hypothetical protein IFM89_035507 [Coptis chinensis]